MGDDEKGNRPNLIVGQSMWVRVSGVQPQVGRLALTSAPVLGCTWIKELPAGAWLTGVVRRPCSDGWIVRVQEPMEGSDGRPGHSCRGILPHSEIGDVEDVIAKHTTVRIRLLSLHGDEARFTMKE